MSRLSSLVSAVGSMPDYASNRKPAQRRVTGRPAGLPMRLNGLTSSVDCSENCFFFLLLEIPPIRAPDTVEAPADFFENSLSSSPASSGISCAGRDIPGTSACVSSLWRRDCRYRCIDKRDERGNRDLRRFIDQPMSRAGNNLAFHVGRHQLGLID